MSTLTSTNENAEHRIKILSELVDAAELQSMMDNFYALSSIPMALIDVEGIVIAGAGWQKVCTDFHRANPRACAHCIESDTMLTADIEPGEARLYRCKNGMWDAAMPVEIGGERIANVFTGQFFFDDEEIDFDFFRAQAGVYGFPEAEYVEAVASVPRLDRTTVSEGLRFLTKLAHMLSKMAYSNAELDALVAEHKALAERERGQAERLRALAEIETVLMSSLDISEVIGMALGAAEAHLDVVASSVWTLDPAARRLSIVGTRNFPEQFLHDFPEGIAIDEPFPVARAVMLETAVLYDRVAESTLYQPVRSAYASYGIELGALAAVPLKARGQVIGGLTLAWNESTDFDADQISLIETIASRFAAAMENARLFQSEHVVAETLQETLVVMPDAVDGVEYSRAYQSATLEPGRVGGDFTDLFPVEGAIVGIALGDVSGKGLDAAVMTSLIRTTLRVHAIDGLTPALIASKTSRVIRRFSTVDTFATVWFGLLDTETGDLRYVSAGHPPAMIVPATGDITELECVDAIIGAFEDSEYTECSTTLATGDRLVLYSDGVTESRSPDGEFLGTEALMEIVDRHRDDPTAEFSDALLQEVVEHSDGTLRDDAAVLTVQLAPRTDTPAE